MNSNSLITINLAIILCKIYNNQNLKNILKSKLKFMKKIQFNKYLSPIRYNSIYEIIKFIKRKSLIKLKNPFII